MRTLRVTQHGESFRQALNEAVRVGLAKLEECAGTVPEVSQTRPLPLGRRLVGGIDNVGEVLAIAEGEDYRLCTWLMPTSSSIPPTRLRASRGRTGLAR